jgi:hypothetical protein
MAMLDVKQVSTSESPRMVGRFDIARGSARVGDIVAIPDKDDIAYDLARISERHFSEKDKSMPLHYSITMLTGDEKGRVRSLTGNVLASVSRNPRKALDGDGAAGTILTSKTDLEFEVRDEHLGMHNGRLAIIRLKEEGENAYALVEILSVKAESSEGKFTGAEFRVNLLAATPTEKPLLHFPSVNIDDFVDNAKYGMLGGTD